jgi:hypothetical protein
MNSSTEVIVDCDRAKSGVLYVEVGALDYAALSFVYIRNSGFETGVNGLNEGYSRCVFMKVCT